MVDLNGTVIAQFLNFFILVAILAKSAYKPICGVMEERKNRIANDLETAEQRNAVFVALHTVQIVRHHIRHEL